MEDIPTWGKYPNSEYKIVETIDGKKIVKVPQNKREDFNPIVRYILFMYDKKSPLHKKFLNISSKKANAIELSGIKEELIENDEVIDMIVEFLAYQNDKLWAVICTNENLFLEYMAVLNTRLDNFNTDKDIVGTLKIKEEVRKYLDSLRLSLDAQYEEFYSGDKDLKEKVEKTRRLRPETVSMKLSNK